ncbi:MAG: phospho-sugar mutase [Clostridia bacterium]|nr:phospho-sugar mutase [Clostridia bacterium]
MNDYLYWISLDEETKKELESITDKKELEDRFYRELEFGTGGMRGIMGAGPNRMNKYTVAKATKGLSAYLKDLKGNNISVAIAYDSRNNSQYFSQIAAGVLCADGIKVYLFDTLMPTPVLSYAILYFNCDAGIVITASHNPKEYNGYKVYDNLGCQLVPKYADNLIKYVNSVTDFRCIQISPISECGDLLEYCGNNVLDSFLDEVKKLSLYSEKSNLKIIYTPLHGTGNIPVRRVLDDKDVTVVASQELPDGNFSTVRSPNPEEKDALNLAIEKAKETGADLVIGTDPDCDRVGVAARHDGDYILLSGNQTGALLVDFILKFRNTDNFKNPAVVKTIVTSSLGAEIAAKHGCKVIDTLTGFKYIGEKICNWEESGEYTYIFGYEESYGYLAGTHARDKDAVSSSMLIAEMAAYHKNNGRTLVDAVNNLYNEYGYYYDCLETIVLKGKEGAEKIRSSMDTFRRNGKSIFDDIDTVLDYSLGIDNLPKENVLKFIFNDSSWVAVRPSGTEPKLKIYFSIKGRNKAESKERQKIIKTELLKIIA